MEKRLLMVVGGLVREGRGIYKNQKEKKFTKERRRI